VDTTDFYAAPASQLVPRLLAEMSAGTANVDVVVLPNMAAVADFQKRGYWLSYRSPEYAAYSPKFKSNPEGFWAAYKVDAIVPAWSPRFVLDSDAPRSWSDLLNPIWKGQLAFADAAPPDQLTQWYVLRQTIGADYWDRLAKNAPKAFPSPDAMAAALTSGKQKIGGQMSLAALSRLKRKGVGLTSNVPQEGAPLSMEAAGILKSTERPNAAKLFLDYLLSPQGQRKLAVEGLGGYSARSDVDPPPGLPKLDSFKGLVPADWSYYVTASRDFSAVWVKIIAEE